VALGRDETHYDALSATRGGEAATVASDSTDADLVMAASNQER
jgi:hypothetical protein